MTTPTAILKLRAGKGPSSEAKSDGPPKGEPRAGLHGVGSGYVPPPGSTDLNPQCDATSPSPQPPF